MFFVYYISEGSIRLRGFIPLPRSIDQRDEQQQRNSFGLRQRSELDSLDGAASQFSAEERLLRRLAGSRENGSSRYQSWAGESSRQRHQQHRRTSGASRLPLYHRKRGDVAVADQ